VTEPQSEGPDPIDNLVAGYLRQVESHTDARSLLERIEADRRLNVSVAAKPPALMRPMLRRTAGWALVASVVLMAFLGGRYFDSNSAHAATLLKNVRTVHRQSIDRCYQVQHAPEASPETEPSSAFESVLWTRGDYFWSDTMIGPKRMKIGRDESGTIWLAPTPKKGIRFASTRVALPRDIETLCQIASLSVPVLVDEVLADFDLKTDGPVTHDDGRRSVIWARLKSGRSHAFLSSAMLEVDVENNLLVRLVLWLHKPVSADATVPNGTVTYTLVDRPAPGPASYRLESHLDSDAVIEDQAFSPPR